MSDLPPETKRQKVARLRAEAANFRLGNMPARADYLSGRGHHTICSKVHAKLPGTET
jgi:hypothetical protein